MIERQGDKEKGLRCCEPRWFLVYRDLGSMPLGMSPGVRCWLFSWAELRLRVAFVPRGICRSTYRSIWIWAGA